MSRKQCVKRIQITNDNFCLLIGFSKIKNIKHEITRNNVVKWLHFNEDRNLILTLPIGNWNVNRRV